jgi:hypothetical protein
MFLPASFATVFLVIWVVGGALLGASLGWYSADLLHLHQRRAWLDAAMGASAVLLLFLLVGATAQGGVAIINGQTLGWRGLLLDHLFVWGLGLICIAVIGRQLLVARRRRLRARASHDAPAV